LVTCNFQWSDVADLGDASEFFVTAGNEINIFGNIGSGVSDIQIELGGVFVKEC
jgi:hypothetical protein